MSDPSDCKPTAEPRVFSVITICESCGTVFQGQAAWCGAEHNGEILRPFAPKVRRLVEALGAAGAQTLPCCGEPGRVIAIFDQSAKVMQVILADADTALGTLALGASEVSH